MWTGAWRRGGEGTNPVAIRGKCGPEREGVGMPEGEQSTRSLEKGEGGGRRSHTRPDGPLLRLSAFRPSEWKAGLGQRTTMHGHILKGSFSRPRENWTVEWQWWIQGDSYRNKNQKQMAQVVGAGYAGTHCLDSKVVITSRDLRTRRYEEEESRQTPTLWARTNGRSGPHVDKSPCEKSPQPTFSMPTWRHLLDVQVKRRRGCWTWI